MRALHSGDQPTTINCENTAVRSVVANTKRRRFHETLDRVAAEAAPLRMPWRNCIAVGRAYELLRSDLLSHLAYLQDKIGYQYCRFHGIFRDDVAAVIRRPDGGLQFQWHQVDKIYDSLLKLGLKPFEELNPMPVALASGEQTIFQWKMNVTPPRIIEEWEHLVRNFTQHLVDRYGVEEVRTWYFEVWNEPNLPGFWSGTQQQYWDLYDASVRAVKSVDPAFRIGGPATSKGSWITQFITHCVEASVQVDFVSTHLYPQDEQVIYADGNANPHAPGDFFADTIRQVRDEVRQSALPSLPIHWTEWNAMSAASAKDVDWTGNSTNDSLYGASFIIRNMIELDTAADTLCWWTASDIFEEAGMPHAPFSGTYSLLTIHGIPKPAFHAFHLLSKLRGRRLKTHSNAPTGCGIAATVESNTSHVILWYSVPIGQSPERSWVDELEVPVDAEGFFICVSTRIAVGAGSCWETWRDLGRPQNLTAAQLELLSSHATPQYTQNTVQAKPIAGSYGLKLPIHLAPLEVLYIEISPVGQIAAPKGAGVTASGLKRWNQAMGATSK